MELFRVDVRPIAAWTLVLSIVVILEAPFWISFGALYLLVFAIKSALLAAACLTIVWGFLGVDHPAKRLPWMFVGVIALSISTTRLWGNWHFYLLYNAAWLVAFCSGCCWPRWRGYRLERSLNASIDRRYRLSEIFLFVAAWAYVFWMVRRAWRGDGWMYPPDEVELEFFGTPLAATAIRFQSEVASSLAIHDFLLSLMLLPAGLAVLRPKWWAIGAVIAFASVCAAQPYVERWLLELLNFKNPAFQVSFREYGEIVWDNCQWYLPQLIPTVALFGLLRLSGMRLMFSQDAEPRTSPSLRQGRSEE